MTLDEIKLGETTANYEPALDYIVAKMPRFPFDKFATAANTHFHTDEGNRQRLWVSDVHWRNVC